MPHDRDEETGSGSRTGETGDSATLQSTPLGGVEIRLGGSTGPDFSFSMRLISAAATSAPAVSDEMDEEEDGGFTASLNFEGHEVVALITRLDLEQRSPEVLERLIAILDADPDGRDTVEQASVWPDRIRNEQPHTKPFHFVDIPLQEPGPDNPPLPPAPHVLSQIEEFSDALRNGRGSPKERADRVSWLFHLFGDIHQPMHCIERFNEFHPGGDRGGNSFRLRGRPNNLHALWDGAVTMRGDTDAPSDAEGLAMHIMEQHPRESLEAELRETDPERWARATYQIAKTQAYTLREDPSDPPRPSAAYKRRMVATSRRQAALAGYRLANRLEQILSG